MRYIKIKKRDHTFPQDNTHPRQLTAELTAEQTAEQTVQERIDFIAYSDSMAREYTPTTLRNFQDPGVVWQGNSVALAFVGGLLVGFVVLTRYYVVGKVTGIADFWLGP